MGLIYNKWYFGDGVRGYPIPEEGDEEVKKGHV